MNARDWLFALALLPLEAATPATGEEPAAAIGGTVWKWQVTAYADGTRVEPPDPSRYTILLMPQGHLSVQIDCNAGGGRYRLEGSALSLQVTHTTRAACPPESLAEKFLEDLAAVRIAVLRDGELYLDLMYDTGTMKFAR